MCVLASCMLEPCMTDFSKITTAYRHRVNEYLQSS